MQCLKEKIDEQLENREKEPVESIEEVPKLPPGSKFALTEVEQLKFKNYLLRKDLITYMIKENNSGLLQLLEDTKKRLGVELNREIEFEKETNFTTGVLK